MEKTPEVLIPQKRHKEKYTIEKLVLLFEEDNELCISSNLIYISSEDNFYLYENGVYQFLSTFDLHKKILWWLIGKKAEIGELASLNISAEFVASFADTLRFMHPRSQLEVESHSIAFQDGVSLDTKSFRLEPWSRINPAFFKLGFDSSEVLSTPEVFFDPSKTNEEVIKGFFGSRFEQFLKEVFVEKESKLPDDELIEFMQLLCGYILLDTNEAQTLFIFNGSGQNGKSVFIEVIRLLIGSQFVSSISLEALTTRQFSLSFLVGKKVNMVSEDESKHMRSDLLKAIISGDSITADRKYESSVQFKPRVKFILASNNLPTFESVEFAIRRRLKIVPFHRRFTEAEKDTRLVEKLTKELPIILSWALRGAYLLTKNNFRFTTPDAMRVMMDEFEEEQSSSIEFFEENFVTTQSEEDFVEIQRLYNAYVEWSKVTGRKAKARRNFLRDIDSRYNLAPSKTPTWSSTLKSTVRVRFKVKPSDEPTAFINSSGFWKAQIPVKFP